MGKTFHEELKDKIDNYIHLIYKVSKSFPGEELYGVTSQLWRSALSVMLNYVEGYARGRNKINKNFLEISYGSLKEAEYLIDFSLREKYISENIHKMLKDTSNIIGAMIWGIIRRL